MADRSAPIGWPVGRIVSALLVAAALVSLVIWPLGELVVVALRAVSLGGPSNWTVAIRNTLLIGGVSAVVTVTSALGAALVTERALSGGRNLLRLGIILPFLIPGFVSALSWTRAYGPGGLLDDLTGLTLPGLFGPVGIVLVVSAGALPIVYLLLVGALGSRTDNELELAARINGADLLTATRTITLRLLTPAIAGGSALAFVIAINAFGVPALLGTPVSFDTATTAIYQDLARSSRPEAFDRAVFLATVLIGLALTFGIGADAVLGRRRPVGRTATGASPRVGQGWTSRWRRLTGGTTWVLVLLATVLPLVALVLTAITRGVGLDPTPQNWTLDNFREALAPRLVGAILRSVGLAAVAATAAVVLGGLVASLRGTRTGRVAGTIVLSGFAVPGSTLAVAMLLAYGGTLRDTLWIILVAYVAKLWAFGHRSILGSVENVSPELVMAARTAGARPFTSVRTVLIPLLRPALIVAWVLIFVIAAHELTMSSLLHGPGTDTVAVAILNLQQLGDTLVSSALAVILTMPVLILVLPVLAGRTQTTRLLGDR